MNTLERCESGTNEVHESVNEATEGIHEDRKTKLKTVACDKKHDCVMAESSFEGEEEEDIQNGRVLYHHKCSPVLWKGRSTFMGPET